MVPEKLNYPQTKKTDHADNYFGTEVADPYRWLEDPDSDETKEWIRAQNAITFDYLSKIPYRDKISNRLKEIWNYPRYSAPFKEGEHYFFLKNDGLQDQPVLYKQKGLEAEPVLLVDTNKVSADGTVAIKTVSVSHDGKYLAYSVSAKGSDWEEIFVVEIETCKQLDDHIKWEKFSSPQWYKNGFFYGSYDPPKNESEYTGKNEFHKVYYHMLGTGQSEDKLVFEDRNNSHRAHAIWSNDEEDYIFMRVNEFDKLGEALYFKKNFDDEFTAISEDMDHHCWCLGTIGSTAYLMTTKDAPNFRLVSVDLNDPKAPWKIIVDEKDIKLSYAKVFSDRLILLYMEDVIDKLKVFSLSGEFMFDIELPSNGCVISFEGKTKEREVFYTFNSIIQPPVIYRYNIDKNESSLFKASRAKFSSEDYVCNQVFYNSKDGTRIPMFIAHKKGLKMDGSNPVYLYAYGGFDVAMSPNFNVSRTIPLENGFIFAMPNLRGGGEYGESWHQGGMMFNKQNVFDDFIAAAEYLINEGYTNPSKISAIGGSNGGLLIAAVENQRPDLFEVCVPMCGTLDMLRYQHFTIGASWVPELGSSDTEESFRNIFKYSPLHNIKVGVNYPATLVTTADHDDRVVPSHSYKYISTLQEKYKGDNPVLIRIQIDAGHGQGIPVSKVIEETTDIMTFIFHNIGITPVY